MPSNVEVKVRLARPAAVRRRLSECGARGPSRLEQTDTYFAVPHGRLKVRVEGHDAGERLELIGYRRRSAGMRTSRYRVTTLAPDQEEALLASLGLALGVRVVVRKRRELWMVGDDRVHLDRVERLGSFLEIEAPFGKAAGAMERTRLRTERLLARLGLAAVERIAGSYVDLLEEALGRKRG